MSPPGVSIPPSTGGTSHAASTSTALSECELRQLVLVPRGRVGQTKPRLERVRDAHQPRLDPLRRSVAVGEVVIVAPRQLETPAPPVADAVIRGGAHEVPAGPALPVAAAAHAAAAAARRELVEVVLPAHPDRLVGVLDRVDPGRLL